MISGSYFAADRQNVIRISLTGHEGKSEILSGHEVSRLVLTFRSEVCYYVTFQLPCRAHGYEAEAV